MTLETSVAGAPKTGETSSADRHLVLPRRNEFLLAVVDGVGHGHEAGVAADLAMQTLREWSSGALEPLIMLCHGRLRATRGAVMSVARIDVAQAQLTWIGIGNVSGALFRRHNGTSLPAKSILLRGGVVGHHLPPLRADSLTMEQGDTLVLATDGIGSGFEEEGLPAVSTQQLADRILMRHGKGTDDALVLVARLTGIET